MSDRRSKDWTSWPQFFGNNCHRNCWECWPFTLAAILFQTLLERWFSKTVLRCDCRLARRSLEYEGLANKHVLFVVHLFLLSLFLAVGDTVYLLLFFLEIIEISNSCPLFPYKWTRCLSRYFAITLRFPVRKTANSTEIPSWYQYHSGTRTDELRWESAGS